MKESLDKLESVFLIDASIYIFQSHFSPNIECFDNKGGDISALYGFTQFLMQFVRRIRPAYIAVAHDKSLFTGFRHKLCEIYKSNRELPDENLAMQLQGCSEVSSILGLSSFGSKVYEADDIIGTLAHNIRSENKPTTIQIVSKDKDLAQLLKTEEDCLWDYSGNRRRYRKEIFEEFGVLPEQFPDYLGLVGDTVDCIKGVPGVGPVKAKVLLKELGSLEKIYENIDKVQNFPIRGARGLAAKLIENQELAYLSRSLATIVCSVENSNESFRSESMEDLRVQHIDRAGFFNFLDEYNFRSNEKEHLSQMVSRITSF